MKLNLVNYHVLLAHIIVATTFILLCSPQAQAMWPCDGAAGDSEEVARMLNEMVGASYEQGQATGLRLVFLQKRTTGGGDH